MTEERRTGILASRIYGLLLRAMPRRFRAQFADEARHAYGERIRDVTRARGRLAGGLASVAGLWDLVRRMARPAPGPAASAC